MLGSPCRVQIDKLMKVIYNNFRRGQNGSKLKLLLSVGLLEFKTLSGHAG